ncbi:copper resistance D family protein [Bacillus marasmi]|uniref:copper resistance D family protein n=1 Tax=Bacillus marasmi TaxID=1926279 RepID=UPI0011C908C3|nr:CopD family protein [Bacillus marasmi]
MPFINTITQALIYVCFGIILGSFILSLVPLSYRPAISVPKGTILTAIAGIAIFSFIPVLQLILYLSPGMGFLYTLQSVLLTFEVGKAWCFTFVLSILLFIFAIWTDYRKCALHSYIGMVLVLILIFALAWSSHASSLNKVVGFLTHTIHFTAVSVWCGILIVISWFSKNHSNWTNFLKWFTPTASFCFISTIVSGLILMTFVVNFNDYTNSWILPYGQTLLIKHLLILPLLIYALINSIFIKRNIMIDDQYNPIAWTRMESIMILLIFSATAALGQQSPPHETVIIDEEVSNLFKFFYEGPFFPEMTLQFSMNITSVSLIGFALLFLAIIIISYIKKAPTILTLVMSVLFVFSIYLSIMLSVT